MRVRKRISDYFGIFREVARIRSALMRAEELAGDVAAAIVAAGNGWNRSAFLARQKYLYRRSGSLLSGVELIPRIAVPERC